MLNKTFCNFGAEFNLISSFNNFYMKKILSFSIFLPIIFFFFGINAHSYGQLTLNTGMTPTQYVQNVLVGTGVTVSNVTWTGGPIALGSFTNGNTTNLGLTNGLVMCSGQVTDIPNPVGTLASVDLGLPGDPSLSNSSYDAAVLAFDFVPLSDTIKFRYVFGSEEYPEYVCSHYNDMFGFFITGPNPSGGNYNSQNIALIPGTNLPVAINTVNNGSSGTYGAGYCTPTYGGSLAYSAYMIDNQALGGTTIVYDGFTTVLTAWCKVTPCQSYHIKLAVADVYDHILDSGVFLEANSFSTNAIGISSSVTSPNIDSVAVEGCNNLIICFHLPENTADTMVVHYTIGGTATNGVDYLWVPDSLVFLPGTDSTCIEIVPIADGIVEGDETINFTFQISVCGGNLTYTCIIRDNTPIIANCSSDTSICLGGSANISVGATGGIGSYIYQWNNGAGNAGTATVSPTVNTTYIVTVSDLCSNIAADSLHVSIFNIATTSSTTDPLCYGSSDGLASVTPTGGASPYTYSWSSGQTSGSLTGLPAGTYDYTITDAIGCMSIGNLILTEPPLLVPTIFDSTMVTCFGGTTGSATVSVAGGTPSYTYVWSPSGGTGTTAGSLAAGTYTVSVTDSHGCVKTDVVTILQPTDVSVVLNAVNEHCSYSCDGQIDAVVTGGNPPYTYLWNTSPSQSTQTATNLCDGNYAVTVTDANGCPKTLSSTVGTNTTLNASISADAIWGIAPFTVNLTSSGASSYLWNFGDGTTGNVQNPSHTYTASGTYIVTLVVNSDSPDYCVDSTSITIVVELPSFIDVPNVFTPNGDGFNDCFTVKSQGLDLEEMAIFNRWGKEVYKWNTVGGKWDGKNENGHISSDGVYYYILHAKGIDKVEYNQQGTVSLYK
jgi:gliding motility-associated-like protein